jgi:hypothetical protein
MVEMRLLRRLLDDDDVRLLLATARLVTEYRI